MSLRLLSNYGRTRPLEATGWTLLVLGAAIGMLPRIYLWILEYPVVDRVLTAAPETLTVPFRIHDDGTYRLQLVAPAPAPAMISNAVAGPDALSPTSVTADRRLRCQLGVHDFLQTLFAANNCASIPVAVTFHWRIVQAGQSKALAEHDYPGDVTAPDLTRSQSDFVAAAEVFDAQPGRYQLVITHLSLSPELAANPLRVQVTLGAFDQVFDLFGLLLTSAIGALLAIPGLILVILSRLWAQRHGPESPAGSVASLTSLASLISLTSNAASETTPVSPEPAASQADAS